MDEVARLSKEFSPAIPNRTGCLCFCKRLQELSGSCPDLNLVSASYSREEAPRRSGE